MSLIDKLDVTSALPQFYLPYAQYVNQTRALPDARDCLKTGTRFILYGQHLQKLTYDKKAKKAVATVNAGMEFSVHGDSSIFGTAVRLSQDFSLRYPLIEVKGNNGNQLFGSSIYSAPRYLEMRSNKIAHEMLSLLDKETIDKWEWNYTQEKKYPTVLPSLFPNFINGCTGIGVAMACSIPQFNLRDVCESAIKLLDNPNASFDELYCPIDFCTGGILVNEEQVKASLKNGTGKAAIIRAKITYDSDTRELIVSEIPYQTTTSGIVAQIQKCIDEGKMAGVESVFDGTDINGVRICIQLMKSASPERVIKTLYKETSLQSHYSINMMMLEDGIYPRVYTFVEMLDSYLKHMSDVLRKSFQYDLKKFSARLEILDGFIKAFDILDEVIKTIRESASDNEAKTVLINSMGFTTAQADAILDMKLRRLVSLEILKLQKERDELAKKIERLNLILSNDELFKNEIKLEIKRISGEYGDERRMVTMNLSTKDEAEDDEVIEEKNLLVHFTNFGNLLVEEVTTLMTQKRGGRGNKVKLDKGEAIVKTITGTSSTPMLLFSSIGKAYSIHLDDLLIDSNINSLLNLEAGEKILEILSSEKKKEFILFVTKNGMVKKSSFTVYNITRKGVVALKLTEGDSLIKVLFANDEHLAMLTHNGIFKTIETKSITPIGRVAQGVMGIRLDDADYLVDAQLVTNNATEIISITEDGIGARFSLEEFTPLGRPAKGKVLHKGKMKCFILINKEVKNFIISSTHNLIKISVDSVNLTGRASIGAKVIDLKGDSIIGVLKE